MKNDSEGKLLTQAEIEANPRLTKIKDALETITTLCLQEPQASIICSISIAGTPEDPDDKIISAYFGDTITQINQFNRLTQNNPQFLNDLQMFLEYRISTQMKEHGTSGNSLADQMLATIGENEKPN